MPRWKVTRDGESTEFFSNGARETVAAALAAQFGDADFDLRRADRPVVAKTPHWTSVQNPNRRYAK